MNTLVAILIGLIAAGAVYCLLRRSMVRLIIGLSLLSQAVNLMVFSANGLSNAPAPIIPPGDKVLEAPYADPLPQALVLTAIVIGFGIICFTLALTLRAFKELGTDDIDAFNRTDRE